MSGVRSKLTSNFEKSGRKGGRREKKRERGKKKRRPTRQSADNTRRYTGRRGGRAYRRLSGQRKLIARGPSDAFFFFFTIHHRNQLKYLGNAAWRQIRAINGGGGKGRGVHCWGSRRSRPPIYTGAEGKQGRRELQFIDDIIGHVRCR